MTEQSLALAGEILNAARHGFQLDDFESESRLTPVQAGRSHVDRMHMLRLMIEQGALSIQGGKMCLGLTQVPAWLFDASELGYAKAQELAAQLLPSEELKRKFDDELLARIGLEGERAMVKMITSALPAAKVTHVSLFDDTLGYDIVLETDGHPPSYIEVKTSSRVLGNDFTFFLSRNEERKSRSISGWELACVSIKNGVAEYLGNFDLSTIRSKIPRNVSSSIEWQTLRIKVNRRELQIQEEFSSLAPVLIAPN